MSKRHHEIPGPTEAQIMARIAAGDEHALGELYDRHGGVAFGLATRVLGDGSLAEDAVSEGFLSLWRSAASFDARRGSARAWLLTLVHRGALEIVQRRERERTLHVPDHRAEGTLVLD